MTFSTKRGIAVAALGGLMWVGLGVAAGAQTEAPDDCYPIPEDGCVDDGVGSGDGVVSDDGTVDADGAADDGVEIGGVVVETDDGDVGGAIGAGGTVTAVRANVLARTGGVIGALVLGALVAVFIGLVVLAFGPRRRRRA